MGVEIGAECAGERRLGASEPGQKIGLGLADRDGCWRNHSVESGREHERVREAEERERDCEHEHVQDSRR